MGAGKVIIFWAIFFTPVGLLVGAIIMFVGIPLCYRFRNIPPSERRIGFKAKSGLTVFFAFLFVLIMCGLNIYDMKKYANDYWKSQGGWGHWRIPLEEPYEFYMIDTMELGSIGIWRESIPIINDVTDYEKHGNLIAGRTLKGRSDKSEIDQIWFLFDCKSGNLKTFESLEQLQKAWRKSGSDRSLNMKTVRDHWYKYWKIVK